MVGREAELGQLLRLVGTGGVALVGGEPGVGKTRLVTEFIAALRSGTTVLAGQSDPSAYGQPYHLLMSLLGGEGELPAEDAAPHDRLRAGVELVRSAVAGVELAVIVADDLHWADAESVTVLERLVETPPGRLVVVATYRPDEVTRQHPAAEFVQRLERRHSVTHLRLDRLGTADVAAFLGAVFGRPPSHRAAGTLHQRTGGNPFFLEELLKAAGETDPDRICVQPLPWTLAEALRSQLLDLDPEHRRVVEAAAVLGAKVSFDLLAAVTGSTEAALIGVLRELVGRGLLVEAQDDEFGFRHALTQEVIAGEMLGRERRRLHEAALEVLSAAAQPDLAAVAVHARGAGRYEQMVEAAREGAAARLDAGSTYAALKLAELGLEEEPDDVELLSTAANAAWLAGYYEDAERHANRWLYAASDPLTRSPALRLLVRLAWEAGEFKVMEARTADVRAIIDPLPDGEERARAYGTLAQSYMLVRRFAEAIEWADRAAAAAKQLDLPEIRLAALVEKGTALMHVPDSRDEGAAMLRAAADEAEHAGEYVSAARALGNRFWATQPGSRELPILLERMRVVHDRAGLGGNFATSYYEGRAWVATAEGDLDAAISALEEADRAEQQWGTTGGKRAAWYPLAALYLERDDADHAEALLRDSPARHSHWPSIEALAVLISFRRGNPGLVRRRLADLRDALNAELEEHAITLDDVVSAGLAAGVPAADLVDAVLVDGRLRPTGFPGELDDDSHPMRRVVLARFAEAAGRYEEALPGFLNLADSDHLQAVAFRRASAHTGAARCLIALGRLGEAHPHVRAATMLLAHWPGWRRVELEAISRRLGLGSAPAVATADPLTPREREVAGLLAEGLSNAEVARRLVISRKTAAVHVSNILAKLGMTSRAQVAAWVRTSQKP